MVILYLLGVVEVTGIVHVLSLAWLSVVLKSTEVVLVELGLVLTRETLIKWWLLSLVVLSVDGAASGLGK